MKQNLFLALLLGVVSGVSAQVTKTQVGNSSYDLQTNNSIPRRLVVLPGGQKIATFTKSLDGSVDALDRGTGYNYFDGTNWSVTAFPYPGTFTRPESQRVGWPNPVVTNGNKENIFTHAVDASGSYGIHYINRTPVGTGPWNNGQVTNGLETWPRAVNTGDSIFVIFSSSSGGTGANTSYQNGVNGGLMMARSFDGGATWVGPDSIPGIGPGTYEVLGGDQYALEIQGKKIAIVTGDNNVTLYRSNDFGTTWTHTDIINTTNFDSSQVTPERRSDGSYSVTFDNSGKAHVMFGMRYSFYDGSQATPGVYYSLSDNGIMYWNENMVGQKPVLIPQTILTNELHHGVRTIPFYNLNTNNNANQYDGYLPNLVSMPSMAVAANGVMYASFSKLRPDNDSVSPTNRDSYGYNMNDVYLIKSYDNGTTWVGPYDVTATDSLEEYFGSIAKTVDGSVHVLYQENPFYGNAVGTQTVTAFNGSKDLRNNKIIYAQVDTGAIAAPADYTTPTLNYSANHLIDSLIINDTIHAYTACAFNLTKADLLRDYVTVFDNSVGSDTSLLQVYTNLNTNVPGTYFYDIIARDASGNESAPFALVDANNIVTQWVSFDTVQYIIQVLTTDVTPPTVTLKGSNPAVVYYNQAYVDSGINATDDDLCTLGQLTSNYTSTIDTTTPGTYTVTWIVTDAAGNSTTVTRTVIAGREPVAAFGVSRASSSSFKFSDSSLYAPTAWKWTMTPIRRTSSARNFTTSFTADTVITMCLEASNQFNLPPYNKPVDSICKTVIIDVWPAGINETSLNSSMHIYPNPSTGMMTLSLTSELLEGGTIHVINMLGAEAATMTIKPNTNEMPLDLSNLESGVYFVKVESAQGSAVRKITISK